MTWAHRVFSLQLFFVRNNQPDSTTMSQWNVSKFTCTRNIQQSAENSTLNISWKFHFYCWLPESWWIYVVDISHLHVFVTTCKYIYISIPTTQPYFCPCWIISSVQQMREEIPHWGALRSAINFYPRKNMCINESDRLDPGKLSFWTQFMEVLEDDFPF